MTRVESQNSLGIYISKDAATAVYLNTRAKDAKKVECFSVSVQEDQEQEKTNMQLLAERIAQGCAERKWKFTETSVALDCTMFMQHSVHSEFRGLKQIGATVKFDTEETLATDIGNVALAFEIASSNETGSDVTVFTSKRTILSDVLSSLQHHHLDPVTIEPDIHCLARFIQRELPSESQQQALFALPSRHCGYVIVPTDSSNEGSRKAPIFRTFLIGDKQDRAALLAREILVTRALADDTQPSEILRVFDSKGTVEAYRLREKLGMDVEMIDLCCTDGASLKEMDIDGNPLDIAIAYGVALTHSEKGHKVDFRADFSPFLGKRLKLQKALKFAAVSVAVLLVAVGVYFHGQLMSTNQKKNRMRTKFSRDYRDVTLGRLSNDESLKKGVSNLKSLLRRIKNEKIGIVPGQKSISSNLTLVLKAFNECAGKTDLKISAVTITDENIIVTADVDSRQNRQTLFDVVEKGGLEIVQQGYESTGGRESFHITIRPKKVIEKTS